MQWETVCNLEDLQPNLGACALVNQQQVALFRIKTAEGDKLFAVGNYCPYGKANVISRGLVGDLQGKIVVASPLYKQHYALESGICLEDDSLVLPTYAVRVAGNAVQVGVEA